MSARIEAIRKRRRDRAMLSELRNNPAWGPIVLAEPHKTLRDYFAAHAPTEPQPWFKPVMPEECPRVDYATPFDLTAAECEQMAGLGDWLDVSDITSGRLREVLERREAQKRAVAAWNQEHAKQVFVQWPWAWADSVLEAKPQ